VAVVGAGIGGAAAARAVRALGAEALVFDGMGRGAGASGNPAALVAPRLDAGLAEPAQLFAQAYRRAVALFAGLPEAIIARGALQFPVQAPDAGRFAKIAVSDLFEPGGLQMLSAEETGERVGEAAPAALALNDALVIEPHRLLAAWAPDVRAAQVHSVEPHGDGWRLLDAAGAVLGTADAVIVAAGLASGDLVAGDLVAGLPLSAVRGQASWTALADPPPPTSFGAYAIPTRDGVLFGATNDRGDIASDLRPEDHRRNLETLALGLPRLAERLAARPLEGRASIRVATPDYLPVAGAAPDRPAGLFVLTGFGARGFTLAPLLAEHVAALALNAPSPLQGPLAAFVDPGRFARRAARRGS
jgi:tRNA 5-methylaminomethyl-2-thiouridine biosynthesis bifunctional protein